MKSYWINYQNVIAGVMVVRKVRARRVRVLQVRAIVVPVKVVMDLTSTNTGMI
jgi:hypothetical protein